LTEDDGIEDEKRLALEDGGACRARREDEEEGAEEEEYVLWKLPLEAVVGGAGGKREK
jgi:hypothetical protein